MEQIKKAGITVAAIYAAAFALRSSTIKLKYFTASEFGPWWPFMSTELLLNLDEFREQLGEPFHLSQVDGGIGRLTDKDSMHYPSPLVLAVDGYPASGDIRRAYRIARQVGFHGIGLYPHWNNPGLHLDMRKDRTPENPALWSAINTASGQQYVDIQQALIG